MHIQLGLSYRIAPLNTSVSSNKGMLHFSSLNKKKKILFVKTEKLSVGIEQRNLCLTSQNNHRFMFYLLTQGYLLHNLMYRV
jgi:hypothetical protein